ncbi:hypothetical protein ACFT9I_39745 [Streptomyces sp. NPDC057137]|uniref:hypothetical protein n=1 Tax=Streptomyces sp. NPDC057137 TaxID=3346030 RepID=UPI00363FFEAC
MGVFARLRRKSKRTAEEARPASSAAGATADGTPGAAEAAPDTGADTVVAGSESATDGGKDAAESVDIPKQQTADEAADNGAGEGART